MFIHIHLVVCVCACVYICMYVCMHIYTYRHTYVYTYIHTHTHIHILKGVGGVQDGWCVSVDMVTVHRDPVIAALHEPVHNQSSRLISARPFSGRRRLFF